MSFTTVKTTTCKTGLRCTYLADTFIQSNLQCYSGYTFFFCQYVCSLGIEPTTFALLTQCSTTEPQEHKFKVSLGFSLLS